MYFVIIIFVKFFLISWLVGWLFCFMPYQHFSDYLMPNQVILIKNLFKYGLVWFGLILWHLNHCRLFNTKSIFIHKTVLFQTIQFSIIRQFKCQKQFCFKQFSLVNKVKWFPVLLYITNNSIKHQSFVYTQLNVKAVVF